MNALGQALGATKRRKNSVVQIPDQELLYNGAALLERPKYKFFEPSARHRKWNTLKELVALSYEKLARFRDAPAEARDAELTRALWMLRNFKRSHLQEAEMCLRLRGVEPEFVLLRN